MTSTSDESRTNKNLIKIGELFELEENENTKDASIAVSLNTCDCLVQIGTFAHRDNIITLKLKDKYKYLESQLFALTFTMMNHLKRNYSNNLTVERLMNESLNL